MMAGKHVDTGRLRGDAFAIAALFALMLLFMSVLVDKLPETAPPPAPTQTTGRIGSGGEF